MVKKGKLINKMFPNKPKNDNKIFFYHVSSKYMQWRDINFERKCSWYIFTFLIHYTKYYDKKNLCFSKTCVISALCSE